MGAITNGTLTYDGRGLVTKAQAGAEIKFTRIEIGDGYVPQGTDIKTLSHLVNTVLDLEISNLEIRASEGLALVGAYLSNAQAETEIYYREIGVYAEDPDKGEILYAYGNAGDNAEKIPPSGSSAIIEKQVDMLVIIGTAENVSAVLSSKVYASADDLNDHIKMIIDSPNGVHGLRINSNDELEYYDGTVWKTFSNELVISISDRIGYPTDEPKRDGLTVFSIIKWIAALLYDKFTNIWTDARAAKLDLIDSIKTLITNAGTNIAEILTRIGLPNPTEAGRSDIFKYLRLLEFQPKLTNMVQFLKDGTFTVPDGVNTIYITACGGGGGGFVNGASTIATAGTATIIGSLVTLLGGGAGTERYGGAAGGAGGGKGGQTGVEGEAGIGGSGGRLNGGGGSLGGGGGGNSNQLPIPGGNSIYSPGFSGGVTGGTTTYHGGNGSLGGGGGSRNYSGGGGGDAIIKKAFNVTPGATIAITVGKGGVGSIFFSGSTYSVGGYGGEGIVIIEW